jgi:hypothetical protein
MILKHMQQYKAIYIYIKKKEEEVTIWCAGNFLKSLLHATERELLYQSFYCGVLQLRTHLSQSNYHENLT